MLYLQCKKAVRLKISFIGLLLCLCFSSFAQRELNMEEHDLKPYYFGISLGFNTATFHTELHPNFIDQDSILTAEPLNTMGFNLGLSATARLNQRFEIRFNPQLIFLDRVLHYTLRYADPITNAYVVDKKVESVITSFPFQVRFLSDRIGNFRVYMMGGGKLDYDLAANAQARKAEDMVKLSHGDYGIEAGIGFKLYYPSFILAPEVKISNGLRDMHRRDEKLIYSNVLDRITSRMIVFTIHLEG